MAKSHIFSSLCVSDSTRHNVKQKAQIGLPQGTQLSLQLAQEQSVHTAKINKPHSSVTHQKSINGSFYSPPLGKHIFLNRPLITLKPTKEQCEIALTAKLMRLHHTPTHRHTHRLVFIQCRDMRPYIRPICKRFWLNVNSHLSNNK